MGTIAKRLILAAGWLACSSIALAQEAPDAGSQSIDDVSRKLADPTAALISVPFQINYLSGMGPNGNLHNDILKIQPVIPIVGDSGKFILRPILPMEWNQYPDKRSGMGDLAVQGYYVPNGDGPWDFGVGPVVSFNTASSKTLGSGKYAAGPAFVAVRKSPEWTMGALLNHLWSFAGDSDRQAVSVTNFQPFITRTLQKGWSVTVTSESSYNWKGGTGGYWTVPLGGTVSKVLRIGKMPVSFAAGGFYNVEKPDYMNKWMWRVMVTAVFTE
ncbi:hypothetical protein [Dyella sp. 20L07]|uniref:hypothetical protein n=1 Tax=Dyella sp. 20L07 TaxID=3384240 RepID=UPI003D2CA70C